MIINTEMKNKILIAAKLGNVKIEVNNGVSAIIACEGNISYQAKGESGYDKNENATYILDKKSLDLLKATGNEDVTITKNLKDNISEDSNSEYSIKFESKDVKAILQEPISDLSVSNLKLENLVKIDIDDIRRVLYAVAIDGVRPLLKGINFSFKNNVIEVVASDGFRVSKLQIAKDLLKGNIPEGTSFVIDKHDIVKVLSVIGGQVVLSLDNNSVTFLNNEVAITVGTMEGKYFNYEFLLKKIVTENRFIVNKSELIWAIETASIADEKLIVLDLGSENMNSISITSFDETSKVNIDINVEGLTKIDKLAFNSKYLLDLLNNLDKSIENVTIEFGEALKAIRVIENNYENILNGVAIK